MNYRDTIYALSCLTFTIVIGGAVYEHLAVVPQWSAAPPASLSMFQGEYGLDAASFWKSLHPVALFVMVAALAIAWKTDRRVHILTAFAGYVVVLIITAIYFVPELLEITGTPFSETIDQTLADRSQLWEQLSIIRLAVLLVLSLFLFLGLAKDPTPKRI